LTSQRVLWRSPSAGLGVEMWKKRIWEHKSSCIWWGGFVGWFDRRLSRRPKSFNVSLKSM
jgi:hypothetical protein